LADQVSYLIKTWQSAVRCLFAPETSLHFASQISNSRIKMKFQVW